MATRRQCIIKVIQRNNKFHLTIANDFIICSNTNTQEGLGFKKVADPWFRKDSSRVSRMWGWRANRNVTVQLEGIFSGKIGCILTSKSNLQKYALCFIDVFFFSSSLRKRATTAQLCFEIQTSLSLHFLSEPGKNVKLWLVLRPSSWVYTDFVLVTFLSLQKQHLITHLAILHGNDSTIFSGL